MATSASRSRHVFSGIVILISMFVGMVAIVIDTMGALSSGGITPAWLINVASPYIACALAFIMLAVFMFSACRRRGGHILYALAFLLLLTANTYTVYTYILTALTSSAGINILSFLFVLVEEMMLFICMIDGFTGFCIRFLSIAAVVIALAIRVVRGINWLLTTPFAIARGYTDIPYGFRMFSYVLMLFGVLLFLIKYKKKGY